MVNSVSPSMIEPPRRATIADLDAMPGDTRAELIDGVIYEIAPRSFEYGHVRTGILMDLVPRYEHEADAAAGWWIQGPNDFVAGGNVFRPEMLGWRRVRMPNPSRTERVDVVPDWIGETVSEENREHVLGRKRAAYAALGVKHLWLVEIEERRLAGFELRDGGWREIGAFAAGDVVRLAPFEGLALDSGEWWQPRRPSDAR